jgi:hypothetical protein
MSNQIEFPFDLTQEQEQLGELFPAFLDAATSIYRAGKRSAEGIIELGASLTQLVEVSGPAYAKAFVIRKTWMSWSSAKKYMRIHERLKDREITGHVPFTTLYLLSGLRNEDEFEQALKLAEGGQTSAEIEEFLDRQRQKHNPGVFNENEDDVKHALRTELEEEGQQVQGEKVLANGGKVDLLTDFAVYECKYNLTRRAFYQALGQTETYCWETGKRKRVIAFAVMEQGLGVLAHQARENGVWLRQVDVKSQRQEASA